MNLQSALARREGDQAGYTGRTGATRRFGAFQPVIGIGESVFDVHFPFVFTERPLCSVTAELDENEKLVPGAYPIPAAVIVRWHAERGPDSQADDNHRLYTGCRMACRISGHPKQRTILHLNFEGLSLRGPFGDELTLEEEL